MKAQRPNALLQSVEAAEPQQRRGFVVRPWFREGLFQLGQHSTAPHAKVGKTGARERLSKRGKERGGEGGEEQTDDVYYALCPNLGALVPNSVGSDSTTTSC